MGVLWIVLGVILIAGVVALAIHMHAKWVREMSAFAESRGLVFRPHRIPERAGPAVLGRMIDVAPIGRGHSRSLAWTLAGRLDGIDVALFPYTYKETSTDHKGNRTTTTTTVPIAALSVPAGFSRLSLRAQHMFDSLAGALGFPDIEFESEEFNRKYHVSGKDRKFASDVIHSGLMEFLCRLRPHRWELGEQYIAILGLPISSPALCAAVLDELLAFWRLVPHFVLQERTR